MFSDRRLRLSPQEMDLSFQPALHDQRLQFRPHGSLSNNPALEIQAFLMEFAAGLDQVLMSLIFDQAPHG